MAGNTATHFCRTHGLVEHGVSVDKRTAKVRLRCRRCNVECVKRRRRLFKRTLIEEAGGACVICGYDRHPAALQFHHRDPATKAFILGGGKSRSLASLRAEAAKCVLLCANCHAEVEIGHTELPA